jgi:arsenate reductase
MKRIYHLSSCNTCQRIIKELNPSNEVELIDIKVQNIDALTLDWLKEKVGSYEQLFSRRAVKFKSGGWNEKELSEADYRELMLKEYTFLKRPYLIYDNQVFIGNSKKEVEGAKVAFK